MLRPHVSFLCYITIAAHVHSICVDSDVCKTPYGSYGVCVEGVCARASAVRKDLKFSIVVKYPEVTLQANSGRELYIRGNSIGFGWQKGFKLNKTGTNTWRTTITYQSGADGFRCQQCTESSGVFNGEYFEYRIYIDDSTDMIGGNFRVKLPISKSSNFFKEIPEYFAYPWFFSRNGKGNFLTINSPQLGRKFEIVLHKPPSFEENPFKSYPTVIVFDLDSNRYNKTSHLLDTPVADLGTITEFIIVGFGDYLSRIDRTDLLSQVSGPWGVCINGTQSDNCGDCFPEGTSATEYIWYMQNKCGRVIEMGGKGNETLDFLVETVLPKVKKVTQRRMLTNQPNLGIVGFSMGGLLACHAAWTRPHIFGLAACHSPSFWWPAIKGTNFSFFFNTVTLANNYLRTGRPYQKIYLDVGGQETGKPFLMAETTLAVAETMATTDWFKWDENIWAFVFPDDSHSFDLWTARLWNPLSLFFPTSPAPETHYGDNSINSSRLNHMTKIVIVLYSILFKLLYNLY